MSAAVDGYAASVSVDGPADGPADGPVGARAGVRVGVDVGSVRVPVRTLPRDLEGGADLQALVLLVAELEAVEVVVGLPRLMSGAEGEAARLAREYALALARRIAPVGVRLVDERLTTVAAHRRLRDSGVPGRGQRAVVDQAAAVLILQSALDAEASTGRAVGELVPASGRPRKKERHR